MYANLHTHTSFSDGSSPPSDYIKEAVNQGFDILGFSDHSPIPIPNSFAIQDGMLDQYCKTIADIRAEESRLHILLGLEYDFIPGLTLPLHQLREQYPFDYIIGSVHLVANPDSPDLWFIDGPKTAIFDKGLEQVFHGNIRIAVTTYWQQIQQMITLEKPDIIGHLDKIKMHNKNRYFNETDTWYTRLVDDTLDCISTAGSIVEVNTRGIYKKRTDSLFPGPYILRKIQARKIPVTITSDAHQPAELSYCFSLAGSILKELGFRSQSILAPQGWCEQDLVIR